MINKKLDIIELFSFFVNNSDIRDIKHLYNHTLKLWYLWIKVTILG